MKTNFLFILILSYLFWNCSGQEKLIKETHNILHQEILANAEWAMQQKIQVITEYYCPRSTGGIHDFYSEGDYWWPDPENPDGPYIRRDGLTNPDNFSHHRLAMICFSKIVGYLASAYIVTGDEKYVEKAFQHINAWFVDPATKMNPNLLYAQAIKGVTTGRGIGIIDTIHLIEVAQGILRMENSEYAKKSDLKPIMSWFNDYITWLTSHNNGLDEMNAGNNHGTCWVMQVAAFAKLVKDNDVLEFCRLRYKNILLPHQVAENGSFPLELSRTKPYGYSLFNLDAMAAICQILSTQKDNLWKFKTREGVSIHTAIDYMYPFVNDKNLWTLPHDVMYWEEWPMAHPAYLFAAIAYNDKTYFNVWKKYKRHSSVNEIERNMPIRNPILWLN